VVRLACGAGRWAGSASPLSPQQLRQPTEVRRHAAGLVLGEQFGRRAPTRFLFEVEVPERLPSSLSDLNANLLISLKLRILSLTKIWRNINDL
jgi:hypothetical protein